MFTVATMPPARQDASKKKANGAKQKSSSPPENDENDQNTLHDMLALLQSTVSTLNETVVSLNTTVSTLKKTVDNQQALIQKLGDRVTEQGKIIADLRNQHQKNDRLRILKFSGLTCDSVDGKDEVITFIKEKLHVQVSPIDITCRILEPRSRRLGLTHFPKLGQQEEVTSDTDKSNVLVYFQNMWCRKSVYYHKKELRNTNCGVFISEDLNKEESHMYFKCRQLRKQNKIQYTWTKELQIFIKTLQDEVKQIQCEEDLAEFQQMSIPNTSSAVPGPSRGTRSQSKNSSQQPSEKQEGSDSEIPTNIEVSDSDEEYKSAE